MTFLWLHFKGSVCVPFNFFLKTKKLTFQKVVNILKSLLIMKSCKLKFVQGKGNLYEFQQTAFVSDALVHVSACQCVMPGYMCLVVLKLCS